MPASIAATFPADVTFVDGACVIRVLHAWLQVTAAVAGPVTSGAQEQGHTMWVSRFVVQAARPAEDQEAAPLLTFEGANAWLAGLLLLGDGFEGRGVRITSGDVYVGSAIPRLRPGLRDLGDSARARGPCI